MLSESRAGKMHTRARCVWMGETKTKKKKKEVEENSECMFMCNARRVHAFNCVCVCVSAVGATEAAELRKGLHESFVIRHSPVQTYDIY